MKRGKAGPHGGHGPASMDPSWVLAGPLNRRNAHVSPSGTGPREPIRTGRERKVTVRRSGTFLDGDM
ncbi:hypothetical protein Acsp03_05340 [Actinomadura sp. NBRC 104412]|nr:hypothetical protein Acsp03_05340 [Actinomadura sp. NBRC 104412]